MSRLPLVDLLSYLEPVACVVALVLIRYRRQATSYRPLVLLLATRLTFFCISTPIFYVAHRHRELQRALYDGYFYVYWMSYALEAVLGFFIIFRVYSLAMAPLRGLQRLGTLMFRWAAGIACALALTMAFGPHVSSNNFVMRAVTELQQTQSILTLCMLLFVCIAIRPMGLSHRSKVFGVCLGLGVLATADLVGSAWLSHLKSMYSVYGVVNGIAICVTIGIWIGYFAVPEPKRRMIILPTTSPFLRWNQISLALGDEPGFVALGDVTPDMFAPAEVEIMRRASLKMRASVA